MLTLPEDLQARLDSGVTTLAWCWRVTRRDGQVFGFTEHDRDLVVDGLTCRAASGFAPGERDGRADLGADQGSVFGALGDDAITEADLANGLCDAEIGDARCGVDLDNPGYNTSGSVASVSGADIFLADGLGGFAEGLFARGRLVWASGANSGAESQVSEHRISGGAVQLRLVQAPAAAIAPGDGFTVTAGCDKRHATCRDRFANMVNFRGHPFLPGNDVLIAGPAGDTRRDGTSRGGAR